MQHILCILTHIIGGPAEEKLGNVSQTHNTAMMAVLTAYYFI